ncbi:MAG: ornithine carbamoyltransferase [Actinobacteria bacterium]|nr:ornithine carbamoyltransferase [Actinomycetota bacterium]
MVKHKLRDSDFLSLQMLDGDELEDLVEEALRLKREGTKGFKPLSQKMIGILMEKQSTRTRVSFEVAVRKLGGYPLVMSKGDMQISTGETIGDTGRVLSRYLDGLVVRTFGQDRLEDFASAASVPVINALTDESHPCQALADMLTVLEYKGSFAGIKLAYLGDGNNVANSLMRAGTKLGMEITIASPEGNEPDRKIVEECGKYCELYGSTLVIGGDPVEAADDADVIYTDVWVSLGEKAEDKPLEQFKRFQVNYELLQNARDDVIVMHCLPAKRGVEITSEVLDGSHSVVWDQAENRLHAQIALLGMIFG